MSSSSEVSLYDCVFGFCSCCWSLDWVFGDGFCMLGRVAGSGCIRSWSVDVACERKELGVAVVGVGVVVDVGAVAVVDVGVVAVVDVSVAVVDVSVAVVGVGVVAVAGVDVCVVAVVDVSVAVVGVVDVVGVATLIALLVCVSTIDTMGSGSSSIS